MEKGDSSPDDEEGHLSDEKGRPQEDLGEEHAREREGQVLRPYDGNVQGWFQDERTVESDRGKERRGKGQTERQGQIMKKPGGMKSIIRS